MTRPVQSWTGLPTVAQAAHDIHWQDEIQGQLKLLSGAHGGVVAFGLGRSYGDVCYGDGGHVLGIAGIDRLIAFDRAHGVIRAEAGMTLSALLALVVPAGWCLPVVPGTGHVTLGGAIANDVHGKNHHRVGTFGCHVRALGLVRSDRGALTCSPGENADLFSATIGGLGLTGVVAWVELALMKIGSAHMDVSTQRFGSLDECLDLSRRLDSTHDYGVAWIDCLATGGRLGRGVYASANHAAQGGFAQPRGLRLSVPFNTRVSMVNRLTSRVFSAAKWHLAPRGAQTSRQSLGAYFHPLDGVLNWNRLYGRKGFQQFQCVLPDASADDGMRALFAAISRSGQASFLSVLKRCGDVASPGLMSFPMAGLSLAIDFPQTRDLADRLLPRLDDIVRDARGRLYPAKDAHMRGEDFRLAYPAWTKVEALRDPAIRSRFWNRVTT